MAASNVAVLVGNGLSIAFNSSLNLREITAEMLQRIRDASDEGGEVVLAMKEVAERALPDGATSEDDFEVLVGAFGAETHTLEHLEHLRQLTQPQDKKLRKSIKRVSRFAEEVRDMGISYVLEVIFERSHAYWDQSADLHSFVKAVTSDFDGNVVFANLNYDTLLLSGILSVCKNGEVADMGHGFQKVGVKTESGRLQVPALRRTKSDFPRGRRIKLLHLHGSVTFWSNSERTVFAKLDRDFLETEDQWDSVRKRTTNIRPVVVLANQRDKTAHVQEFPFSLAYEMFDDGLTSSDHWLIVGYSFKDAPVNARLAAAFKERDNPPQVLVVTFGDQPSRDEVEAAFGWTDEDGSSEGWLTINRDGANGVEETDDWANFIP